MTSEHLSTCSEIRNAEAAVPFVQPEPLSAARLMQALRDARITHLITVPDTYQKTFLAAAMASSAVSTIVACTEDEAVAINAGLYVAGHRTILSIQNNGLYACVNTLRGIALDGAVPTVMIIGQYGQKAHEPPEKSPLRMVHMLEPTLATWNIPFTRLYRDQDIAKLPQVYEEAVVRRGPSALIIPIPTIS
jgi:sulfopyruvate decarboxylase TPP-binding subunit